MLVLVLFFVTEIKPGSFLLWLAALSFFWAADSMRSDRWFLWGHHGDKQSGGDLRLQSCPSRMQQRQQNTDNRTLLTGEATKSIFTSCLGTSVINDCNRVYSWVQNNTRMKLKFLITAFISKHFKSKHEGKLGDVHKRLFLNFSLQHLLYKLKSSHIWQKINLKYFQWIHIHFLFFKETDVVGNTFPLKLPILTLYHLLL